MREKNELNEIIKQRHNTQITVNQKSGSDQKEDLLLKRKIRLLQYILAQNI